jgi:hypothetical protein
MTEEEWLACKKPMLMLRFLRHRGSERKLRLFGCACCREIWDYIPPEAREFVENSERYADGLADEGSLLDSRVGVRALPAHVTYSRPAEYRLISTALEAAKRTAMGESAEPALEVARLANPGQKAWRAQCQLLRCIFGNPFCPAGVDSSWLRWNDSTIPRIAQGIYEERAFGRLPILADALLDAGCDDEAILSHCRGDGPHVRGCWAIDLILGKE